jgi:hypothetical protein
MVRQSVASFAISQPHSGSHAISRVGGVVGGTGRSGAGRMNEPVAIQSGDYWVKIVEILQQNWGLIETNDQGAVRVY